MRSLAGAAVHCRYAELLEARGIILVTQNVAPEIGCKQPTLQAMGFPSQIAEEIGLSVDTVRCAFKPKPVELFCVKEVETGEVVPGNWTAEGVDRR